MEKDTQQALMSAFILSRSRDFRFWLKADLQPPEIEVCSSPNSGRGCRD